MIPPGRKLIPSAEGNVSYHIFLSVLKKGLNSQGYEGTLKPMARFDGMKGGASVFLAFLFFLWFMNFSARTIFSPLMPLIEDEFMISHAKASSIYVFSSLGYGIALFLSGMFCGHFGYKKSILVSILATACVFFSIPAVKSFSVLCLFSFILGLSTAVYLPSIIPLITEYYEERLWGRSIAIHDSAASMSIFAAPFIALFFLGFLPWRQIFTVFGVIFVAMALVFWLVAGEVKIHKRERVPLLSFLKNSSLWIMGAIWTFAAGANLGVYYVVPLYLTKELLFDIGHANTIFGWSRIGGIIVAVLTGFIVDRFSLKKIMFIFLFLSGLLTVLLTAAGRDSIATWLFIQASVVMGFFPVGLVAISRMFGREQRSMATGFIVTLGVIFGLGVVPYFLGLAGDLMSFRFGILIFGILVMLSSGLTFFSKDLR